MEQLFRRFRSCQMGSALTEYGLIIAALVIGLIALLGAFRNAVGGVTTRTATSISSHKSSRGFGYSGGGARPVGGQPAPETPPEPDPEDGDSTGVAVGSGQAATSGNR